MRQGEQLPSKIHMNCQITEVMAGNRDETRRVDDYLERIGKLAKETMASAQETPAIGLEFQVMAQQLGGLVGRFLERQDGSAPICQPTDTLAQVEMF